MKSMLNSIDAGAMNIQTGGQLKNKNDIWELINLSFHAMAICCNGEIVAANTSAAKIIGVDGVEALLGRPVTDFVLPEARKMVTRQLNRVSRKGTNIPSAHQKLVRADGAVIDTEIALAHFYYNGREAALILAKDVTEQRRLKEELYFERACFQQLFNSSPDAIVVLDNEDKVIIANKAFSQLFQYENEEIRGMLINQLIVPEDFIREASNFSEMVMQGQNLHEEAVRKRKDGTLVEVSILGYPVVVKGEQVGIYAIYRDISKRKKAERTVTHLSYFDPLTGLPNRILFNDRFSLELAHARKNGHMMAIIILDLDKFKNINDTLGHSVGDKLLKAVADRLKGIIRETDTFSRMGGDEFILLMPEVVRLEDVADIAQGILDVFRQPFLIDSHELYITTSMGISVYPDDGNDVESMVMNADTAMYRAKDLGRNNYQFFTKNMNRDISEQMELMTNLRRAIAKEEFAVYYQPRIGVADGKINGMEALVRWKHPALGLISPDQFIPMAEETGLIVPIGEWVLREACVQNKAWQDAGLPPMPVAVNLSARQFQQQNMVKVIDGILKETGLDPEYLELEITESTVAFNMESALKTIRQLKDMGIHISLDDFGTGYSSFSQLKNMNIDILKIDQSFIRDLNPEDSNFAIVSSIISMAHSLNMEVTAEGVEKEDQLLLLKDILCDNMQGNLFSEPLPASEFKILFGR